MNTNNNNENYDKMMKAVVMRITVRVTMEMTAGVAVIIDSENFGDEDRNP